MTTRQSTTKTAARRTVARRIPKARVQDDAATLISDQQAALLGRFCDAIGFMETACVALETDEKTTFAVPCLRLGLDMLHRAYNELDTGAAAAASVRPRQRVTHVTWPIAAPTGFSISDPISYPRVNGEPRRPRQLGHHLRFASAATSNARGKSAARVRASCGHKQ